MTSSTIYQPAWDPSTTIHQPGTHLDTHSPWTLIIVQAKFVYGDNDTYRNSPQAMGHPQGANERLMGQKQNLKDQKPKSSVEHEIKSSSTSEASQLPADSAHDMKQLETDPRTRDSSDRRVNAGSTPKALLVKKHL
jgi:hypothetical protein